MSIQLESTEDKPSAAGGDPVQEVRFCLETSRLLSAHPISESKETSKTTKIVNSHDRVVFLGWNLKKKRTNMFMLTLMEHYRLFDPSWTNSELRLVSDTLNKVKTSYPGHGAEGFVDPFVPVTRGCVYSFSIQSLLAAMIVCEEQHKQLKVSRIQVQPKVQGSTDLHRVWRGQ